MTNTLSLASFGPAMLNHLWQSTVVVAAVWLVTLLLRRNPASIRSSLWLAASVKFLVPFSLLIGLGSLFPRPSHVAAYTPQAVYSAADAIGQPFSDIPVLSHSTTHTASFTEQLVTALPVTLMAIWLCGAAIVLLVWTLRWRQVAATLRRAVPMEDGREVQILRRLNSHTKISARASQESMEPGIFGILRPILIWPDHLSARLEDEHVEAILAHELMHVRRRDNLIAMLHMAVEALFWFHPLVWWMERRMMEERERACDEAVVQMGGRPEIYAESLLKACRFCLESPLACIAGITGADLKVRIRSVMTFRLQKLNWSRKLLLAALAVAVVGGPVVFGVFKTPLLQAQTHPSDAGQRGTGNSQSIPSFAAATIKPSSPYGKEKSFRFEGRKFTTRNTALIDLMEYAWGVHPKQVADAPEWIQTKKFDLEGVSDQEGAPTPYEWKLMVQQLLEDRFGLTLHLDKKEMSVFALTVAKTGSKLTKSRSETLQPNLFLKPVTGGISIVGQNAPLSDLVGVMQELVLDRPVVDQTELSDKFDFTLSWTPDDSQFSGHFNLPPIENGPPGLFTAIQSQMGLKLESMKAVADILVVDRVAQPSEN